MNRNEKGSPAQRAIASVVYTACAIAFLGMVAMIYLNVKGLPIEDRLDKYATAALIGALALLGRTSDAKAEAKDAVEKVVEDMTELGAPPPPPPPTQVDTAVVNAEKAVVNEAGGPPRE